MSGNQPDPSQAVQWFSAFRSFHPGSPAGSRMRTNGNACGRWLKLQPRGDGVDCPDSRRGVEEKELRADRDYLLNLWQKIPEKSQERAGSRPALP